MRPRSLALALAVATIATSPVHAQPAVPAASACSGPRAATLDFWVGRWRVVDAKGALLGMNQIDKVLKGCALIENWREPDGSEGKSLFYFNANTQIWRQLRVEDDTRALGGIKEKLMVSAPGAAVVRFQGTLFTPANEIVLDRTTLEPLRDGRVRQSIAISKDGGANWHMGFDAFYIREP